MNFKKFKAEVQKQFAKMLAGTDHVFTTSMGKDELWDTYLAAFPEGTNPIFRERTEHDCQCCRQFIRNYGRMVVIKGNQLHSIWDGIEGDYKVVADAMAAAVKSHAVENMFLSPKLGLGIGKNHEMIDGRAHAWNHLSLELPERFRFRGDEGAALSKYRSNKEVFKRGLEQFTIDAIDTVLDLIDQGTLYRGEEHRSAVSLFKGYRIEYAKVAEKDRDNFCWLVSAKIGGAAKIRNTAIGTLLIDIAEGKSLDASVRAFDKVMAPANYKRPNAVITKKMVAQAKEKITSLGFADSLARRYAVMDDITINNVIFANRDTKVAMDALDELAEAIPVDTKKLSRVEEVGIDDFLTNILPHTSSLELMVENKHEGNLVSLIAPAQESPSMFKWGSGFSWTYNGGIADSIKQRVKAAGGNVEGVLRCSLSWYNTDDLDIHVKEPGGNRIYFDAKQNRRTTGHLDVDMNAGRGRCVRDAVENITWTDESKMEEGVYKVFVNNYSQRESVDWGFEVEVEYDGDVHSFSYDKVVRHKEFVDVAQFDFSRKDGLKLISGLDSKEVSKEIWGVHTGTFQKVSMIMNSPNHWDGEGVGNKHLFFMLEGCVNPESARGFFNEFLKQDLMEQKRVFEALGSKMMAESTPDQLSGLGFSSTQRNSVLCKVEGAFSRTIKINF